VLPIVWVVGRCAAYVLLGIIIYVIFGTGTIQIELSDPITKSNPSAKVEVKIDGKPIDIAALKGPLRLSAGEHAISVTGPHYKAFGQPFTVWRGENAPLRITLMPTK